MPNAKLKCKSCKKWFPRADLVRVGMSSYCSSDCQTKDFFEGQKRSTSKSESSTSPDLAVVESLRAADGYKCRVCGKPGNLITHHIRYKSDPEAKPFLNDRHNLISLHNEPCHLKIVHGHKYRFQPLLLGLVWLREVKGDSTKTVYQLEKELENDRTRSSRFNWGIE